VAHGTVLNRTDHLSSESSSSSPLLLTVPEVEPEEEHDEPQNQVNNDPSLLDDEDSYVHVEEDVDEDVKDVDEMGELMEYINRAVRAHIKSQIAHEYYDLKRQKRLVELERFGLDQERSRTHRGRSRSSPCPIPVPHSTPVHVNQEVQTEPMEAL
jgi:hypothetical protein